MTKKQEIIELYVENQFITPDEIALKVRVKEGFVNKIIAEYRREIICKSPMYLVKSIDILNIYYLFTETQEIKIKVVDRIIQNIEDLTEYQKCFLYENNGFR